MERVFHVYNEARHIADERGGESSSTVYMDACIIGLKFGRTAGPHDASCALK